MAKHQTKKYIIPTGNRKPQTGNPVRHSYAQTIMEQAPAIPKPLDYVDIDKAFQEWVQNDVDIKTATGKPMPTVTLYSSQRFSEYSQTWKHTDEEGNLLMNFKTINRETDPNGGDNQGGYWNIPGDRWYTYLIRTVLDDNGTESYEVYSMKQPYTVDLTYRINIVTNLMETLNEFNAKINDLFKSRQCYLRPNGRWIPMVIEDVSDETQYSIEDQKFYVQTVSIKVMAYIIREQDMKVERRPKRVLLFAEDDTGKKPKINVEEYVKDGREHPGADIQVTIAPWKTKASFDFDMDMRVDEIKTDNVRSLRIFVNNTPIFYEKGFNISAGDNVRLFIKALNQNEECKISLIGYYTTEYNLPQLETPEKVCDENDYISHETTIVE